MSSKLNKRLYKNGQLTNAAKDKLRQRLEKENRKPKVSKYATKKTIKKSAAPKTDEKPSNKSEQIQPSKVAAKPQQPATPKKEIKSNASTLRMDDITDTPPRQELVRERKSAMDQNNDVNWISLIGHNQIEAETEEQLYQNLEKQSNTRFRADLDAQIRLKRRQQEAQQQQVAKHRRELNVQYDEFSKQEQTKQEQQHQKVLQLKAIRSQQVDELNYRRKYEEMKCRKHELKEVEKLKKALEAEKADNAAKKEANKKKLQQFLLENEEQKKIKNAERLKEEAEEIRLQKEYAKMLKEQEENREKQLKATYEKQQQKFMALINATADIREKAEQDAIKADKESKRRQMEQDEKERAKKERLRQEMEECKKAIDAQIAEKMASIKRDILEDKQYGEMMKTLHAEYVEELNQKKLAAKRKQDEQKQYLEQQIAELHKKKQEQKTEMSETEKLINKKLLDEVRGNKLSPNKKGLMMKQKQEAVKIDPRAPFQWRYAYRNAPF